MRLSFDKDNRQRSNIQISINGNQESQKRQSIENDTITQTKEEKRQKLSQIFKKVVKNIKLSLLIQNLIKEQITSENITQKTMTQVELIKLNSFILNSFHYKKHFKYECIFIIFASLDIDKITQIKPIMRNYEQLNILQYILQDIPYFSQKNDSQMIRQYCKYIKLKKFNASDIIFMTGTSRTPLSILWKGQVTIYKPKSNEILKIFEDKFQKYPLDAQNNDKINQNNLLQTSFKLNLNKRQSIKRNSIERNVEQSTSLSKRFSFPAKLKIQQNKLTSGNTQSPLSVGFSLGITRNSIFKGSGQDTPRRSAYFRKATAVVEAIKKDINFENSEILSNFYENEENSQFNHQFIKMIDQGYIITDDIDNQYKFDPSSVRTMSAFTTQDNTYIFYIDYLMFNKINQNTQQIKLENRNQKIFEANSYSEQNTKQIIEHLLLKSKIIRLKKNETVYQQTQIPNNVYFLLKGDVLLCLEKGKKKVQLLQIKEYTAIGDYNALSLSAYSHTALCQSNCKLLAVDIDVYREQINRFQSSKKEIMMKAINLNNFIEERMNKHSSKNKEQAFKGNIIYQTPIKQKNSCRISFNDFSDISSEFGGDAVIKSPSKERKLKQSQSQQTLIQCENDSQIKHSNSNYQINGNQYTVELKNKTIRSLYYKEDEQDCRKTANQDQLIQIGLDLGYKNIKKVSNINEQVIKQRFGESPSQQLQKTPFFDQTQQSARQMIQKQDVRRLFDTYTFKLEKKNDLNRNNSYSNLESQSPLRALQFLDNQKVDILKNSLNNSIYSELLKSSQSSRKRSNPKEVTNIHTQQLKQKLTGIITYRDQKRFKEKLNYYNQQQRLEQSQNSFSSNNETDQNSLNQSQSNVLKLVEQPHQSELRKRITSLIQSKERKDSSSSEFFAPFNLIQPLSIYKSQQTPTSPNISQQRQRQQNEYQQQDLKLQLSAQSCKLQNVNDQQDQQLFNQQNQIKQLKQQNQNNPKSVNQQTDQLILESYMLSSRQDQTKQQNPNIRQKKSINIINNQFNNKLNLRFLDRQEQQNPIKESSFHFYTNSNSHLTSTNSSHILTKTNSFHQQANTNSLHRQVNTNSLHHQTSTFSLHNDINNNSQYVQINTNFNRNKRGDISLEILNKQFTAKTNQNNNNLKQNEYKMKQPSISPRYSNSSNNLLKTSNNLL